MQLPPAQQFLRPSFLDGRHPGDPGHALQAKPQFRPRLSGLRHWGFRCSVACFESASGLFRPVPWYWPVSTRSGLF